jgi:protein-tyrosine kinase
LKRAAAAPRLAAARGAIPERAAERPDRSVLQQYPQEDRPLPGPPASGERIATRLVDLASQRSDAVAAPRPSKAYQGKLVIDAGISPTSVEQYRRLAATMHHLQAEHGLRRLMVSSAVPKEGKTLTVVNLALTLSESYNRRVLLIDADLRRPSVHEAFGIPNRHGLRYALRSDPMDLRYVSISPNLWVLPAGAPDANPMAALASREMERLLDEVTSSFDWILVDAPPLGTMADAGLLARLTRAVIVVIAAGSTSYALVEKVIAELGRDNIVGTVLNGVGPETVEWSSYYDDQPDVPKSVGRAKSPEAAARMQKVEQFGP